LERPSSSLRTTWTRPTRLCERLAIIDHGRIIAQGTPQELKSSIPGGYLLRLRFDRVPEELIAELRKLPGVTEVPLADHIAADVYATAADRSSRHCEYGAGRGHPSSRCAHFRTEPSRICSSTIPEGFTRLELENVFRSAVNATLTWPAAIWLPMAAAESFAAAVFTFIFLAAL